MPMTQPSAQPAPLFSENDYLYMARAMQLARRGLYTTHPNPQVGCVIVRNNTVVGEGWHQRAGEHHAEINALEMAGERAAGADVYVTLEPCSYTGRTPPCSNSLIKAGVRRVVAAMVDPNPQVAGSGLQQLHEAGIQVAEGLMETESRALNPGFISGMQRSRPFVRIKMAMSLDGRTAMASGESVWITGESARRDVQRWRARSGAVLTGIDTVLMDRPALNVRLTAEELGLDAGMTVRQPERIILDSSLRLPVDAPLLKKTGGVRVYTCAQHQDKIARLEQQGVRVRRFPGQQLALDAVLSALYEEGINEVHVECGATLAGRFIEQGLADELLIYMAPHLMGSAARPLFNLPLNLMQERRGLIIKEMRALGDDWRIRAAFQD